MYFSIIKTKAINIFINDTQLEVAHVKRLGIYIDEPLTWNVKPYLK